MNRFVRLTQDNIDELQNEKAARPDLAAFDELSSFSVLDQKYRNR